MNRSKSEPGDSNSRLQQQSEGGGASRWRFFAAMAVVFVLIIGGAGAVVFHRFFRVDASGNQSSQSAITSPLPEIAISGDIPVPQELASQLERLDPSEGGWGTEAFSEAASGQLKQIGKLLAHPTEVDSYDFSSLSTEDFTSSPLRPLDLEEVFSDSSLIVLRTKEKGTDDKLAELAVNDAIKGLCSPFEGAADLRSKFKIVRVSQSQPFVETVVYYQAAGRFSKGTIQQNATWLCRWEKGASDALPRLASIRVVDYEEVVNRNQREKWFHDCTGFVLNKNSSYMKQILYGIDHWRSRLHQVFGFPIVGHRGLAIADVNGDGLDDLLLCQPTPLPNRLFVQNSDGTATDVSARAGVDSLNGSSCVLFADFDNDDDQDLVVTDFYNLSLSFLENDGAGKFAVKSQVPIPSVGAAMSLSAADFDKDGKLDIYVCVYDPRPGKAGNGAMNSRGYIPATFHDANNGGENVLLRNNGQWSFTNVTSAVGLDANNRRFSLAACWEDYDNDGDPDLYVANDYGRNNLYRNDDGRFLDVAAQAGVEDIAAGMSVTWGDYNNDGWMDLYVSNMFSAAGNRITYQSKFKPESDESIRKQFQHHARGNSLFENAGDGTFRDVSLTAHVAMGRWAWGSCFVDINNDGLEDLLVANGYVTQKDTGDL